MSHKQILRHDVMQEAGSFPLHAILGANTEHSYLLFEVPLHPVFPVFNDPLPRLLLAELEARVRFHFNVILWSRETLCSLRS